MNAQTADFPVRSLSRAVLLFGDNTQRRDDLGELIGLSGGRIGASGLIADALEHLDAQPASVDVVLDLRGGSGSAPDQLLERLNALAVTAGRQSAVILMPVGLIDQVVARIVHPGVELLVDPGGREVSMVIADLVAPLLSSFTEGQDDGDSQIARARDEVSHIARTLAMPLPPSDAAEPMVEPFAPISSDSRLVRAILRLRRLRNEHFASMLFADPAWDILLDLMVARIERQLIAASSLCIAAAVPATTALRWITQMTGQGLLVRQPDPRDGRRVFIGLSEPAARAMDAYLSTAKKILSPVV